MTTSSSTNTDLNVQTVPRVFLFKGLRLPDPQPSASVETAVKLLAVAHPELASAKVGDPVYVAGVAEYACEAQVGRRG